MLDKMLRWLAPHASTVHGPHYQAGARAAEVPIATADNRLGYTPDRWRGWLT